MKKFFFRNLAIMLLLGIMAATSSFAAGKTLLSEIKPYATTGYYWAFEGKQSSLMGGSYSMTMMGKKYPDGFKFGEPGTAIFNLDSKYSEIKGKVGLDDFENKKDTAVSFYADNQLIEYIDLKAFTAPIAFEIDVTGVTQLRIVKEKGYSEVDFVDLTIEAASKDTSASNKTTNSETSKTLTSSAEGGSYLVNEMDPYATTGYYWAFGKTSTTKMGGDKSMTMGGKRYFYGFKFGAPGTAMYNLDGKYETLTGIIGLDDFENKKDTGVEILGDGMLLEAINLPAYTLPQSFTINVSGVKKLEIIKTPGYSEVDLAELKLHKGTSATSGSNAGGSNTNTDNSTQNSSAANNGTNNTQAQENSSTVITYKEPNYNSTSVTKIKTVATSKGPNYTVFADYAQSEYDDVYFLNGQYVTGGTHGIIKTSYNGRDWTTLSTGQFDTVTGIAYGQGAYIATTDTGKLMKSTDLKQWITLPTGELTNRFYGTVYFNNAFYALAENGVVFKSDNASTFTKVVQIENAGPNAYTIFRAIKVAGDKLFVLSEGYAYTSSTGSDWTKLDLKARVTENGITQTVDMTNFYDVKKGGDLYLITSSEDYFTSKDGLAWESHQISGFSPYAYKKILAASYMNGQFQLYVDEWLQGSVDERYIIRVDQNGMVVEADPSQRKDLEGNKVTGAEAGPAGLVVVGSDILHSADGNSYQSQYQMPSTRTLLSETNGNYFMSKRMNMNIFSRNGFITRVNTAFSNSQDRLYDVAFGNGVYVAVGDKQVILTSGDLINFTETLNESQKTPDMNMRPTISRVEFYNGKFIAMDYNGQIYTSQDGKTWTVGSIKSGYNSMILKGVINGKLTAVGFYEKRSATGGYEGDYGLVLTSTDGKVWTEHTLRGTDWISDIAFMNGQYIVTGQAGTFALSKDLENWAVYKFDAMSEIMTQLGAYANILEFSGIYVYDNTFFMAGKSIDGYNPNSNSNKVYQVGDSQSVYKPGDNKTDSGKKNSGFVLSSSDGVNWTWVMPEMRLPVTDVDQISGKLVMTLEDGQILLMDHQQLQ